MKKLLILIAIVFTGCEVNYSSDTTDNSMVDNSMVDNSITDSHNNDSNNTDYRDDNATVLEDIESNVYRSDYSAMECTDAGYFFCSIEGKCLNQVTSAGVCPG